MLLMPMSGLTASNDCNFVQSCLMLLFIDFFVLLPAEEYQDREHDNDAHARHTAPERYPVELHEGVRVPGLVDDPIPVCLTLLRGLGRSRPL